MEIVDLSREIFHRTQTHPSRPPVVNLPSRQYGASLIAAMINGVFGLLTAWVLARYSFPGKGLAVDRRLNAIWITGTPERIARVKAQIAAIDVPVRILQGGADPDVPWTHALALANALTGQDVVFTLIKDGDHRLSRPQDLERLTAAVSEARGLVEIDDDPVARRLARAARARGASLASAAAWAAADLGPDED